MNILSQIELPDFITSNASSCRWVELEDRQSLPVSSGVYLAIDASELVLYVGKAKNLKTRWSNHHKIADLYFHGCEKIVYIPVDLFLLDEIEKALIRWFDPPLNICYTSRDTGENGKRVKGVPVDWDEVKKRRNLILTDTAWDLLQEKGDDLDISRSEVVERMIRGLIAITPKEETGGIL